MPLEKRVGIEVIASTWSSGTPPAVLTAAVQASPIAIDVTCALLFTALWTRPPVRYGFSLSDCWAWLRYFPAIAATPDLRLCDAWKTIDPHHKTVLSGDLGVGFTTWFLNRTLGFVRYSDTLWVVNTLSPGAFQLAPSARRGPRKSPDYIAEDGNGDFSVLECKGTQNSRDGLADALDRGAAQKANLQAIGSTQLRHSLVAGLFIPQFDSADSAVIVIADPTWDDLREHLSRFSTALIARAVSQVAYAKELAMLELSNAANAMVRAKDSEETVTKAIERDLAKRPADQRVDGRLRLEREYLWSEQVKVSETLAISGVRFHGELPPEDLDRLTTMTSPAEHGEAKRGMSRGQSWKVETSELTVALRSPTGATYSLTFLVE